MKKPRREDTIFVHLGDRTSDRKCIPVTVPRDSHTAKTSLFIAWKKNKKLTLILVFKNLVLLRKLIVPLCLFLTEKILFHPTSSLFGECGSRGGEKFHRSIFLLRLFLAGILLYMETSKILHREINRKNRVTVHLII